MHGRQMANTNDFNMIWRYQLTRACTALVQSGDDELAITYFPSLVKAAFLSQEDAMASYTSCCFRLRPFSSILITRTSSHGQPQDPCVSENLRPPWSGLNRCSASARGMCSRELQSSLYEPSQRVFGPARIYSCPRTLIPGPF